VDYLPALQDMIIRSEPPDIRDRQYVPPDRVVGGFGGFGLPRHPRRYDQGLSYQKRAELQAKSPGIWGWDGVPPRADEFRDDSKLARPIPRGSGYFPLMTPGEMRSGGLPSVDVRSAPVGKEIGVVWNDSGNSPVYMDRRGSHMWPNLPYYMGPKIPGGLPPPERMVPTPRGQK
jgi:hypothetical protein